MSAVLPTAYLKRANLSVWWDPKEVLLGAITHLLNAKYLENGRQLLTLQEKK